MKQTAITIRKLWLLALILYAFYFFYSLFNAVRSSTSLESWELLRYGDFWAFVFSNTVAFLLFVLAVVVTITVLGPETLLAPIRALTSTNKIIQHTELTKGQSENRSVSLEDLYRLHLDYHESVKRAYNHTITQYSRSFNFSLLFAVMGFCLIFYALLFKTDANPNWPSVFVSAVIQSVPALFFYLSDRARRQMTQVFGDLRRDSESSRAFELLKTLEKDETREAIKEDIIRRILLAPKTDKT